MSSPKKFKRGWMIVSVAIVAALLAPWGWNFYKESRPKEVRIREAIEDLVVADSNPSRPRLLRNWERFVSSFRAQDSSKRAEWVAVEKLRGFGIDAFPYLIDHFNDERRGPKWRASYPQTVGVACELIIEGQLCEFSNVRQPLDFERRGADGSVHVRPGFNLSLFGDDFKVWLLARKDRSLAEMQLEVHEWALAEEEKIGLFELGDEEKFIAPLRRKVSELRNAVEAERKH